MRQRTVIISLFLALAAVGLAKEKETLEQLKARAARAKPQDQPRLFMAVAERQVEAADKLYTDGDSDKGKAAIEDATSYAEKAGQAAITTGKDLKHTEIAVRKLSDRMQGIWHSLAVDDRPPLKAATERLDKLDSQLLDRMFKGKK
jgi:hypothetical protein